MARSRFKHQVLRTPSDTVNVIGAGGLRMSAITEIYGENGSGKTAFSYQTGGAFQEDYPHGVVHILDAENSIDYIRLVRVFKMIMDRTEVHVTPTLEGAYEEILAVFARMHTQELRGKGELPLFDDLRDYNLGDLTKYASGFELGSIGRRAAISLEEYDSLEEDGELNFESMKEWAEHPEVRVEHHNKESDEDYYKRIWLLMRLSVAQAYRVTEKEPVSPVVFIWDTIAVTKPRVEVDAALEGENSVNAGGMGLAARLNTQYLSIILAEQTSRPLHLMILNQVRLAGFGSYQGPYQTSSGGNALKHNAHYRLCFNQIRKNWDEDLGMNVGTLSKVTLEKSKFCPTTQDVFLDINDRLGGVIVPSQESASVCAALGLLKSGGGWWRFTDPELDEEVGGLRWDDNGKDQHIYNNPSIREKAISQLMKHYRVAYTTLDMLYDAAGYGSVQDCDNSKFDEAGSAMLKSMKSLDYASPEHALKLSAGNPDEIKQDEEAAETAEE